MRRILPALVSIALFSFGFSAHASTINPGIYNLDDAFVSGFAVTGTVTLNSSGNVTLANLTFNDPSLSRPAAPVFNWVSSTGAYNGLSQNYLSLPGGVGQMGLIFNTIADANGALDLCLGSAQCGTTPGTIGASSLQVYWMNGGSFPNTNFSSGYLTQANVTTPMALTPEPASLFLLGTGIIGLAGISRMMKPSTRFGGADKAPETLAKDEASA